MGVGGHDSHIVVRGTVANETPARDGGHDRCRRHAVEVLRPRQSGGGHSLAIGGGDNAGVVRQGATTVGHHVELIAGIGVQVVDSNGCIVAGNSRPRAGIESFGAVFHRPAVGAGSARVGSPREGDLMGTQTVDHHLRRPIARRNLAQHYIVNIEIIILVRV